MRGITSPERGVKQYESEYGNELNMNSNYNELNMNSSKRILQ